MKKAFISALVWLLPLLCFAPRACADVTFPDPEPVEVGQTINHLAASVEPGSSVTVSAGSLPPGVELAFDEGEAGTDIYLRGIPTAAGDFDAVLSVNDERSFLLSVGVRPEMPKVIAGPNVSCFVGENIHVSVTASVSDGGTLGYQWYASDGSSYSSLIENATESFYEPGTAYAGTTYYYCEVTNTSNGVTVSTASPIISVTVNERQVTQLQLLSLPEKTEYVAGELLDTAGLVLQLSYSDGSSETLTAGYRVSPTLLDNVGTQTVELSYEGFVARFEVTVQEPPERIESIEVLTLPRRTSYVVGETLDPAGLSVRATLNRGTRDITEGLRCDPMYLGQEGIQTVTVYYGEHSCAFTVTVESEERPGYLSLHQLPEKLSYRVGEAVDTRGLVLYLVSNHNNVTAVTEGFEYSPTRLEAVGQQIITVSYAGFTVNYTVNVSEAVESPLPAETPLPSPPAQKATPPLSAPTPQPVSGVGSRRSFVGVIAAASAAALAAIGVYVYVMNRGGFELLEERLEAFLRRGK